MSGTHSPDAGRPAASSAENVSPQESVAAQIARVQALLTESLAQLRESFCQLTQATPAATGEDAGRRHLDRAVIALQSEDTLGQLLEGARQRAASLEAAVEVLRTAADELAQHPGATDGECCAQRALRTGMTELSAALAAAQAIRQTVRQDAVEGGSVQLF